MTRVALACCLAALVWPASALADAPVAEIVESGAHVVARAGTGPWASPADYGYALRIGSSQRTASGVELRDVSVLGGRIHVTRLTVSADGTSGSADGITLDGASVPSAPNTLLELGDGDYAVVLQQAVLPGKRGKDVGVVGLRVVVGARQLLIGLSRPAAPANVSSRRASPWLLFGLAPVATVGGPAAAVPEPSLAAGGPLGVRAVALAERFLGTPYVWAGASPLSGFDCSGLVMYVYAQLGIHLTHFSGAQFNEGRRIPVDELQPGDIVFFHPGPLGPGHEGLYLGGGKFIHAPHTGDVVKISELAGSYALGYVGAVRPY